jgi:hypothetical protein
MFLNGSKKNQEWYKDLITRYQAHVAHLAKETTAVPVHRIPSLYTNPFIQDKDEAGSLERIWPRAITAALKLWKKGKPVLTGSLLHDEPILFSIRTATSNPADKTNPRHTIQAMTVATQATTLAHIHELFVRFKDAGIAQPNLTFGGKLSPKAKTATSKGLKALQTKAPNDLLEVLAPPTSGVQNRTKALFEIEGTRLDILQEGPLHLWPNQDRKMDTIVWKLKVNRYTLQFAVRLSLNKLPIFSADAKAEKSACPMCKMERGYSPSHILYECSKLDDFKRTWASTAERNTPGITELANAASPETFLQTLRAIERLPKTPQGKLDKDRILPDYVTYLAVRWNAKSKANMAIEGSLKATALYGEWLNITNQERRGFKTTPSVPQIMRNAMHTASGGVG